MTFLTFTLTRRPVFTGEYDANDEPICRKPVTTVHINAANIVSIDIRAYSDHTDLLIKTVDGDVWTIPGTPEHLAQIDRLTATEVRQ